MTCKKKIWVTVVVKKSSLLACASRVGFVKEMIEFTLGVAVITPDVR